MKYMITALLFILAASCTKQKDKDENACFRVKMVASLCADVVLQIQDPQYYDLGEDNWPNPQDSNLLYNHVFLVKNYCSYNKSKPVISADGTFSVRLATESENDCIVCMAILPGRPQTEQKVIAVSDCK